MYIRYKLCKNIIWMASIQLAKIINSSAPALHPNAHENGAKETPHSWQLSSAERRNCDRCRASKAQPLHWWKVDGLLRPMSFLSTIAATDKWLQHLKAPTKPGPRHSLSERIASANRTWRYLVDSSETTGLVMTRPWEILRASRC